MMRRLICVLAAVAGIAAAQNADDKNKQLLEKVCSGCHSTETALADRHTRAEWEAVVNQMVSMGATASAEEIKALIEYLTSAYGKTEQAKK